MSFLHFHSTARRFLRVLGYALAQAAVVGGVLGLLASQRPERGPELEDVGFVEGLVRRGGRWLEGHERTLYDWRARALGRAGERSDRVVVVALDDETLAEARQDERLGAVGHPWPRELLGALSGRLLTEGAALVALDLPFSERSARSVAPAGPAAGGSGDDDAGLRERLDAHPGKSLLSFGWDWERPPQPGMRLLPTLVRVGQFPDAQKALPGVQAVLVRQRPAFVLPAPGATGVRGAGGVELWAGVASDEDGRELAAALGVRGTPVLRPRQGDDEAQALSPADLQVRLAAVTVEGLDPERLPEARGLRHPVSPLLGVGSTYGASTLVPDADGAVRAVAQLVRYTDAEGRAHVLPSLPLAAAMRLAGATTLRYRDGRLLVGDVYSVPMDADGYSLLRWDAGEVGRGARGTVSRGLSAWDTLVNLLAAREGAPARFDQDLDGRVVVLTDTSRSEGVAWRTPVGAGVAQGAVLAQALVNVLEGEGVRRASPRTDLLLCVGAAFAAALLALLTGRRLRSGAAVLAHVGALLTAAAALLWLVLSLFLNEQLWVAAAGPLLALGTSFALTTVHAFRTEREVRDFVQGALGRYVSPEVARLVTRDLSLMRPERRPVTVYFSDVDGFTSLAEQLPPERLVALLNEYFTEMTAVVRAHGGQVDKYVGDAVIAFWGAPVRTERHAQLACASALEMRAVLLRRQPEWEERYGHRIQVRAGINSGEAVVGDMGSELKSNYTVMGRVVSTGTWLERANAALGTHLLVGEETARLARDEFVFREVDRLPGADGVARPVYELVDRAGALGVEQRSGLELFAQALEAWHAERPHDALPLFERCEREFRDPVAGVYVARCRERLGHAAGAPQAKRA